jgi:molecular chaperone DnaK
MAKDNKSLGKFQLTGIPPAPRGVPQIEVSFDIDANGILKVSARDKGTGREQSISITNTGGLSSTEIDRMRQEAEVYADDDIRRRKLVELKNQADSLFYSYETTLRDNGEFIGDYLKQQAQAQAEEWKKLVAQPNADVDEVKQKLDAFQQTLLTIGAEVYKRANQQSSVDEIGDDDGSDGGELGTTAYIRNPDDPLAPDGGDFNFEEDATITADYEAVE